MDTDLTYDFLFRLHLFFLFLIFSLTQTCNLIPISIIFKAEDFLVITAYCH